LTAVNLGHLTSVNSDKGVRTLVLPAMTPAGGVPLLNDNWPEFPVAQSRRLVIGAV